MNVPARRLSPHAVTCVWCGTHYEDIREARCPNCGGPLPAAPGAMEGIEPPPPPRPLHGTLKRRLYVGSFLLWFGAGFLAIGVFFGILFVTLGLSRHDSALVAFSVLGWTFVAIGGAVLRMGLQELRRKIFVLENGKVARGELLQIGEDSSVTVNDRHPWLLEYAFTTATGAKQVSKSSTWDAAAALRQPGDALWVVYDPKDPDNTALWPPHA